MFDKIINWLIELLESGNNAEAPKTGDAKVDDAMSKLLTDAAKRGKEMLEANPSTLCNVKAALEKDPKTLNPFDQACLLRAIFEMQRPTWLPYLFDNVAAYESADYKLFSNTNNDKDRTVDTGPWAFNSKVRSKFANASYKSFLDKMDSSKLLIYQELSKEFGDLLNSESIQWSYMVSRFVSYSDLIADYELEVTTAFHYLFELMITMAANGHLPALYQFCLNNEDGLVWLFLNMWRRRDAATYLPETIYNEDKMPYLKWLADQKGLEYGTLVSKFRPELVDGPLKMVWRNLVPIREDLKQIDDALLPYKLHRIKTATSSTGDGAALFGDDGFELLGGE